MLKKAMFGVALGLAMVPMVAMADMQSGALAFNVHGVSDGKNISIVTNGWH